MRASNVVVVFVVVVVVVVSLHLTHATAFDLRLPQVCAAVVPLVERDLRL